MGERLGAALGRREVRLGGAAERLGEGRELRPERRKPLGGRVLLGLAKLLDVARIDARDVAIMAKLREKSAAPRP